MDSLKSRAEVARKTGEVLTDFVELDGVRYDFLGYVYEDDGRLEILWRLSWNLFARTHMGQEQMAGFHGEKDFGNHDCCPICYPEDESIYWDALKDYWREEMHQYGVETWQPGLTF